MNLVRGGCSTTARGFRRKNWGSASPPRIHPRWAEGRRIASMTRERPRISYRQRVEEVDMATVILPAPLRPYAAGQKEVSVAGTTGAGAPDGLGRRHPP